MLVSFISSDKNGNEGDVVGGHKLILESGLTHVEEISLDDVISGGVDDNDELVEEIVVGGGFSSNTGSLECFPTWKDVELMHKKMNKVVDYVVVIAVEENNYFDSIVDRFAVDLNVDVHNN